jgi:hypothetical protein
MPARKSLTGQREQRRGLPVRWLWIAGVATYIAFGFLLMRPGVPPTKGIGHKHFVSSFRFAPRSIGWNHITIVYTHTCVFDFMFYPIDRVYALLLPKPQRSIFFTAQYDDILLVKPVEGKRAINKQSRDELEE